jgi:hypothetical protein
LWSNLSFTECRRGHWSCKATGETWPACTITLMRSFFPHGISHWKVECTKHSEEEGPLAARSGPSTWREKRNPESCTRLAVSSEKWADTINPQPDHSIHPPINQSHLIPTPNPK